MIRWEWPPWLKLTGLGKTVMIGSDLLIARFATPSTVPTRDCRFFDTQPFARCRVSFAYDGGLCPIYEEFVFNDAGDITFIEAWSDQPDRLPGNVDSDPWMEASDVRRLSTRVPGLGYGDGHVDPGGSAFIAAASMDPELEDLRRRMLDFWITWADEVANTAGNLDEDALYADGCGWD
ncbi:MAG: hypothetical protein D6761_02670 [Candidatus Dadabacteria bacterium]|nr:MAG: hypothetical protein D6761_02670 [Candidatus Dadabacteria bacterium]